MGGYGSCDKNIIIVTVDNSIGAKCGDIVGIYLPPGAVILPALIVFLCPYS